MPFIKKTTIALNVMSITMMLTILALLLTMTINNVVEVTNVYNVLFYLLYGELIFFPIISIVLVIKTERKKLLIKFFI